jgi:hypothetical protein
MHDQDQPNPWCIIRLMPQLQRSTVARFSRRCDAEAHINLLRHMMAKDTYVIVFDGDLNPI